MQSGIVDPGTSSRAGGDQNRATTVNIGLPETSQQINPSFALSAPCVTSNCEL